MSRRIKVDDNKKNRQENFEPRTASANKETKDKDVWRKRGTYTYPDGSTYIGEFNKDGVKHGTGTFTSPDGSKYEGEWKDGMKHGKGTQTYFDGEKYSI